ncbi:histidine-specific methyltransferase [Pisolithus orientalis]|uniref:histidine-specific methyltransferase n=1 Tax=Pisolithus orientalis TaxID=936130 RepID=UPI0022256B04|nr:histidine-specific methyltransferase [Pisolithus orientalis]KAI5998970.1 histidine-specific methyltransferase [Pisolithus orientalis]
MLGPVPSPSSVPEPPASRPGDSPALESTIPIIDIRSTACSVTVAALEEGIRAGVLAGFSRPYNEKELPNLLLYNEEGLRLFEQITYQPDYYLTGLEIDILSRYAHQIADSVPDGAILLELGAGALRKTALILDALEAQGKAVTYFALDLDKPELLRTLAELKDRYTHVSLAGLWGTYDDGCTWLKQIKERPRIILWLGSSVGNMTRKEAGQFIRTFGDVLAPRDRFIIAIDSRYHKLDDIRAAYNDRAGVTRRFALNALGNINDLFNANVVDVSCFDYNPYYNEIQGRNEAYFRCLKETQFKIPSETPILVHEGEYIRFAFSHKYDRVEGQMLWTAAGAYPVQEWASRDGDYALTMLSWAS